MADDEHTFTAVLACQRVDHTAQSQNDVAPALPPGRWVIELAEPCSELSLLRIPGFDTPASEPIQNPELLLSQTLVDDQPNVVVRIQVRDLGNDLRRLPRARVGRSEQGRGSLCGWHGREPAAKGGRLGSADLREWHVRVARLDVDQCLL